MIKYLVQSSLVTVASVSTGIGDCISMSIYCDISLDETLNGGS